MSKGCILLFLLLGVLHSGRTRLFSIERNFNATVVVASQVAPEPTATDACRRTLAAARRSTGTGTPDSGVPRRTTSASRSQNAKEVRFLINCRFVNFCDFLK